MARYIDDRYIEATMFCILPTQQITTKEIEIKSYKRGWNDAINAILRNAPTADVRENVRGHLSFTDDFEELWGQNAKCSRCGCEWQLSIDGDYNFCPNCGADLRGGQDGK